MTTENASPPAAPATTTPAISAADAAVSLVVRTASATQSASLARVLRVRALFAVSLGVLFFLARVATAHLISLWQMEEIVTRDSEMLIRMVDRNATLIQWLHTGFGLLAIVGVVAYAIYHIRLTALHARLPLTEEAATRRPRAAAWAALPALLLAGVGVASQIVDSGVPRKPSAKEYYIMRSEVLHQMTREGASLTDIAERDRMAGNHEPWYIRAAGPEIVQRWYAVQLWLPAAFALLVLVLMVPVYSVQKLRIGPDDIVPSPDSN